MPHGPQDRAFDDAGGSGSTDDGSDFFDEDTDYSTDLPEEEQLAGATDEDDERDDDDDRESFSFQEEGGAAPAPGDEGAPGTDETEGTTSGTSFQEEGGAAPAPPTRESLADEREVVAPSDDQGIEADPDDRHGAITPEEAARARELEAAVLARNPDLRPGDVAVREGGRVELTAAGRVKRATQSLEQRLGIDVDPSEVDVQETGGGSRYVARYAPANPPNVSGAPNLNRGGASDREDILRRLDEQIEEKVSEERADRMGGPFAQAAAPGQPVDLERGVDYTVTGSVTGGLTAELTPSYREERARETAESSIERELLESGRPTDIDPQRDIRVEPTVNEQGETVYRATLTEEGRQTIATSDLGPLQSDVELDTLRITGPSRFGYALATRREGEIPLPVGPPGSDVRVPLGEDAEELAAEAAVTFRQAVVDPTAQAVGSVDQVTLTSGPGAGAAAARGRVPVPIFPIGGPSVDVAVPDQASTFLESEVRGAGALVNPGGAAKTTVDAVEYAAAGAEAAEDTTVSTREVRRPVRVGPGPAQMRTVRETDVDSGFSDFAEETGEAALIRAEQAIAYARENPVEFSGAAVGALAASAIVMGGAGSLSRGAGLTSRLAIQPGEELLGYGGNRLTRRVASARTAERLFPDNEPLIFSEEAAIRRARGAGRRLVGGVRRTRRLATGEEVPFMTRRRVEFARPESSLGVYGDEPPGITGAVSEPLGSPTAGILEATTDLPGAEDLEVDEGAVQPEPGTGPVSRPDRLPLYGAIRERGGVRAYIRGEDLPGDRPISPGQVEGFEEERQPIGGPFAVGFGRPAGELVVEEEGPEPFTDYSQFDEPITPDFISQRQSLFGEFEGEPAPFEGPRARRRAAARQAVELERRQRLRRRLESAAGLGVEPMAQLGLGPRAAVDVVGEVGDRGDIGTESDQETRIETELTFDQRIQLMRESGFEFNAEVLSEAGSEIERESEDESEIEVEVEPDETRERPFGFGGRRADDEPVAAAALGAGWINKYAVALAGGSLAQRGDPEDLEAIAGRQGTFLPLPTEGQVNPDEELAAGLEDVESLFFLGDGDGGSDVEEWFS